MTMSDAVAENKVYFNQLASEYDRKFHERLIQIQEELRKRATLLGVRPGGRLLDYACGTGLISFALGPQLSQCVGIDISESMVEQYNGKAKSQGLSSEVCTAYLGNLIDKNDPSPAVFSSSNFFNFDLAGVGLGFHHIEDGHLAAKRLVERLLPGGTLFVVDFVAHESEDHHIAPSWLRHHGFTEHQMRDIFEGAGVAGNFVFEVLTENITFPNVHGEGEHTHRRVFLARGEKKVPNSAKVEPTN